MVIGCVTIFGQMVDAIPFQTKRQVMEFIFIHQGMANDGVKVPLLDQDAQGPGKLIIKLCVVAVLGDV